MAVLFSVHLFAQSVLTGRITDQSGNPIPGATILISGTTQGTTSDFDGNFTLNVPDNAQLEVSSIGFTSQTVSVYNKSTLSIVLSQSLKELNEIVVTALGLSCPGFPPGHPVIVCCNWLNIQILRSYALPAVVHKSDKPFSL